jgi:hypothetical protein
VSTDPTDLTFNWVEARASCSAATMFARLRTGAQKDVDTRNQQIGERFGIVDLAAAKFAVYREGPEHARRVEFERRGEEITVRSANNHDSRRQDRVLACGSARAWGCVGSDGPARTKQLKGGPAVTRGPRLRRDGRHYRTVISERIHGWMQHCHFVLPLGNSEVPPVGPGACAPAGSGMLVGPGSARHSGTGAPNPPI